MTRLILESTPEELFTKENLKNDYKELAKVHHPDHGGNKDDFIRLNELYKLAQEKINNGCWGIVNFTKSTLIDDAGFIFVKRNKFYYFNDIKDISLEWWNKLSKTSDNLPKYLFKKIEKDKIYFGTNKQDVLKCECDEQIFTIEELVNNHKNLLTIEHIAWIGSRLFEFAGYMSKHGISHSGLIPNSIFVAPKTHGVLIPSFYHTTRLGQKLKTISFKHKDWYPARIFSNKIAIEKIDIDMIKRNIAYLFGIKSGSITQLSHMKINKDLINFLFTDLDAKNTYVKYRELLNKIFGNPKFHVLTIPDRKEN